MSYTTTVGKILLKNSSPASTHEFLESKELDKKNIGVFFADLAEKHPDQYMKTVSDLTRLGFETATRLGSTVRLGDLLPPSFKEARFKKLNQDIADVHSKHLTKAKEKDAVIDLLNKFSEDVNKEMVEIGIKENKTLAKIVRAGARGSPSQYRQTIFSPVSVNDNKGGILTDFIIDRSFAEGLTLPQYLAHTFGSRQASAATKLAVASAGFLGKQLSRSGMTMVVELHDCGTHNGIAIKTTDKDYLGSFLAKPVDKYNYNNEVTSAMLSSLQTKGINDIIVRNPITCQASHNDHPNAVCQLCVGRREKGLPTIGAYIGVTAGTTLAEPLCIAKGTLVKMADFTDKPIEDIKVGDKVMGVDILGHVKPANVVNTFANGIKDVRTYSFQLPHSRNLKRNTLSITCTEEHKVLAYSGRKFTTSIRPIKSAVSRAYSPATITSIDDIGYAEPLALLIGLLIGDGTITTHRLHLSCGDPVLLEDIKNYCKSHNIKLSGNQTTKQYYLAKYNKAVAETLAVKLTSLGLLGHKAKTKFIPKECYSWNTNSILALLAGIISTDGCVSYNKAKNCTIIDITSISKELLDGIKDLLYFKLGITTCAPYLAYAGGEMEFSKGHTSTMQDCYALRIGVRQDVKYLLENLPLVGKKKEKVKELLSNTSLWNKENKRTARFNHIAASDPFQVETFDIEIDNESHLYLLSNQLVVSNSQGMLNSKHSGGSARSASSFGGFKYVNQLFNIPETFVHEAPLATKDGTISKVRIAPQGGHYVDIKHDDGSTEEHYIHPDLNVFVHEGHKVEEGDVLSDGIPNPAKIVKHKGIGAGRVYFSNQIKNTFENSQLGGINKRNFDTISKNLISHVRITDNKGIGNYLPGTVVNYHSLEKDYQPRPDSKKVRIDAAKGLYLETPELHYTIGTKLTHSMIANLKHHGIDYVDVHDEPPGFEPEMVRLLEVPAHEHDWMHALYSTNLERRLIKAVNSGESSSITGPSPVGGLAYAVNFGKKAEEIIDEDALSFE